MDSDWTSAVYSREIVTMTRRHISLFCVLVVLWPALPALAREPGELFPVIEPFERGYLKVSDLHSITYSLCGNQQGKPVFVLHGGPGVGCYPRLTQYFNPEKFLIVLHDQRGAGFSIPRAELRENNTQNLVEDIERLREHLKIEGKILIFGGSWGSTLAMAYAEAHPERVSGMVLRGVFTATDAEINHIFKGESVRLFFPETRDRFEGELPPGTGDVKPRVILDLLNSKDDALGRKVADAWLRYGMKLVKLHVTKKEVEQIPADEDLRGLSRIDCHYMSNRCFLEEGQLLRDAHKIKDIPTTIINGRYDMLTPPLAAYRLHNRLPLSKLIIVEEAGHSEGEEGTTRELVKAVAEFE